MPKFASLSNYTYQINYTLNACVKYMFCILCIVVTMSLQCLSPNKISVLFCSVFYYWQLLKILFADDRTKKTMELHLFVNRERENLFVARQISARQRGAALAFIPDPQFHL